MHGSYDCMVTLWKLDGFQAIRIDVRHRGIGNSDTVSLKYTHWFFYYIKEDFGEFFSCWIKDRKVNLWLFYFPTSGTKWDQRFSLHPFICESVCLTWISTLISSCFDFIGSWNLVCSLLLMFTCVIFARYMGLCVKYSNLGIWNVLCGYLVSFLQIRFCFCKI